MGVDCGQVFAASGSGSGAESVFGGALFPSVPASVAGAPSTTVVEEQPEAATAAMSPVRAVTLARANNFLTICSLLLLSATPFAAS